MTRLTLSILLVPILFVPLSRRILFILPILSILFVPLSRRILFILPILSILFVPILFVPPVDQRASAAGLLAPSVTLSPGLASPQPVGTTITWTATARGFIAPLYQWRVGPAGGPLRTVRAFYTGNTYQWSPLDEGAYQVEVVARERYQPATRVAATATFDVVSRLTGDEAAVTLTGHPLVALYSAPPCRPEESGETPGVVTVEYRRLGTRVSQLTSGKPCVAGRSANLYVAGMYQSALYQLRHVVTTAGRRRVGPWRWLTTGAIPPGVIPRSYVSHPPDPETSAADDLVLLSTPGLFGVKGSPYVADLTGRPLWYYETSAAGMYATYITRLVPGGALALVTDGELVGQVLREIDLAGNAVRTTNVIRVNEELAARGIDQITAFHHEATRLPNGQTLALGATERLYTDVQGYVGPIDVLGDVVIALDEDWQVIWAWSAFDHLDVERGPAWQKLCRSQQEGCPPFYLAPEASDWLHSNSIAYTPADGNLLVSLRMQDWVIKLRYEDGTGDGAVLWRLGLGGDFELSDPSGDSYPWFSSQHDATPVGPDTLALYDNGNTRCGWKPAECWSRGQVYELDEASRTARLLLNAHLQGYSQAWGAAQRLSNGNYHFTSGSVPDPFYRGDSVEVRPDGQIVFVLQTLKGLYRSYRHASLYEP